MNEIQQCAGLLVIKGSCLASFPFRDGCRYRLAKAVGLDRLDLYHEDPDGPWIRLHGTLLVVAEK